MEKKAYYSKLAIITVCCLLVNYLLINQVELMQGYEASGLLGIVSSCILSIWIFNRGNKLFAQSDKSSFISWIMASTLIKMISSFGLLLAFAYFFNPPSNYFIAPYFIFYFIYFIFETMEFSNLTKR